MIAIEGIMGTGKTTLQKRLQQEIDTITIEQDFEHNISLKDSYLCNDFIFEKQMIFLYSDYHLLYKNIKNQNFKTIITDFTLERSEIMARLFLTSDEYHNIFLPTYRYLLSKLKINKMIILLHGDTNKILLQIKKRNRQMEQGINEKFLEIRQTQLLNNLNSFICDKMITLDINTVDIMDDNVIRQLVKEIVKYEGEFNYDRAQNDK